MTAPREIACEGAAAGAEWLRLVPAHWDVQPLGRLGTFAIGKGGDRRDEDAAGVPCIRYGDLYTTHRRFVVESRSFVARERAEDYTPIRFGDVLFAATGETVEAIGASAVNLIRSEACCGRDVIRFRPHRTVDARYLGYATDCLPAASQKAAMGRGVTVAHVYPGQLKALTVALPPLAEQIACVRFLDRAERRIEKLVRAGERAIALLEERRRATAQGALTGQFDVRTRRPYPSYRMSGVPWLGDVPRHWIVERLKSSMANIERPDAACRQDDTHVALEHVESWTGRLGRVALNGPPDGRLKRFDRGDVLYGGLRPYLARVACPPEGGLCAGEFLVLRPRRSAFAAAYVARLLRSKPLVDAVDSLTRGARVPRADWSTLGRLEIVRPPLPEQIAIAAFLDRAEDGIDRCIARVRRRIELITEYRARLTADVLTGRRAVSVGPVSLPELVPYAVGGDLEDALGAAATGEPEAVLAATGS